MRARRLVVGLILAAALASAASSTGSTDAAGPHGTPQVPAFPAQLARIASVRVYQSGHWTVPGENATTIGRALAGLHPTWVSSLLR